MISLRYVTAPFLLMLLAGTRLPAGAQPFQAADFRTGIGPGDSIGFSFNDYLGSVSEVEENPVRFELKQNFPNPFNGVSNFEFEIGDLSDVSLLLFDILGQGLAVLAEGRYASGRYSVRWDARTLPTGVYWYRLEAVPVGGGPEPPFISSKKLILLR